MTPREDFDVFGGHAAGVCYMQNDFESLRSEPKDKTLRRVKMTKEHGHHSVYDHQNITLYLEGVPRVIEAILNNERMMTSSIKSGRYTIHAVEGREKELFEKWVAIFKTLIKEKYPNEKYLSTSRIEKLSLENARFLTSCFTKISMMHTLSYRQLNYVYGFIRDFIAAHAKTKNTFLKRLLPYLRDLLKHLDATGYIDEELTKNGKGRRLSLFNDYVATEYFGDVYATTYKMSFAVFIQTARHRTLKHHIATPPNPAELEFYVPEIIKGTGYEKEWKTDLEKIRDIYPQGMLVSVTEMGNLDDFILKVIERKCVAAQLEIMSTTNVLLNKYHAALKKSKHPRTDDLSPFTKGSKCTFPQYKCPLPCEWKEAITEKRKI
jgi:thymidylate synthase ThyX